MRSCLSCAPLPRCVAASRTACARGRRVHGDGVCTGLANRSRRTSHRNPNPRTAPLPSTLPEYTFSPLAIGPPSRNTAGMVPPWHGPVESGGELNSPILRGRKVLLLVLRFTGPPVPITARMHSTPPKVS
eukprot:9491451-Pyramimonas_sp.AAC.2